MEFATEVADTRLIYTMFMSLLKLELLQSCVTSVINVL